MPENSSYSNIMTSIICNDDETINECLNIVSNKTLENFHTLYNMIDGVYGKNNNKQSRDKNSINV